MGDRHGATGNWCYNPIRVYTKELRIRPGWHVSCLNEGLHDRDDNSEIANDDLLILHGPSHSVRANSVRCTSADNNCDIITCGDTNRDNSVHRPTQHWHQSITMTHTVAYNSELHILELKVQGNLLLPEVRQIISESVQLVKKHNCFLALSDYREATLKLSTLEIYEIPKIIEEIFTASGLPAYKVKRALVVAKDLEDFKFFENITVNRMQNAKLFQEFDEAKKWLLEK
jgi:hypothetical protein